MKTDSDVVRAETFETACDNDDDDDDVVVCSIFRSAAGHTDCHNSIFDGMYRHNWVTAGVWKWTNRIAGNAEMPGEK